MLRFVTLDLSFFDKNRVTKCNASVSFCNPIIYYFTVAVIGYFGSSHKVLELSGSNQHIY